VGCFRGTESRLTRARAFNSALHATIRRSISSGVGTVKGV
jgi:hypothetical protein